MTPIHHHVYHHVRKHHKKYLFLGTMMAGFFAITKIMVLFATSFALFSTSNDTSFADDLPISALVQDTGTVVSGADTTQILSDADIALLYGLGTGSELTGSTSTGNTVDTGTLIDLITQHIVNNLSGTEITGSVTTWVVAATGVVSTGTIQTTGVIDTGAIYYETLLANQITYCHTGDILMSTVLSGQNFGGITSFQWELSNNCILDNLSFQLYDHNKQWIEVAQLSGSNRGFSFDTHFLQTGWYSTTGLNASGQVYVSYTGLYSGVSSSSWTGYQIRILNDDGNVLYQSSGFTIDNLAPKLSGFKFVYTGEEVHFLFAGSKELDNVKISLSVGKSSSYEASWTNYDYYIRGFGTGFTGAIGYSISFSDLWGNTWSVSGTGYLSFTGSTSTGTILATFQALKQEIAKFNQCKSKLSYKPISLDVSGKTFNLMMPTFKKAEVKKLVSAFSYFVVKKLDTVHTLGQTELDSITKTYNNFLVVLKLVRDDDNDCKQNLGNYYMGVFTSTMENYGITEL